MKKQFLAVAALLSATAVHATRAYSEPTPLRDAEQDGWVQEPPRHGGPQPHESYGVRSLSPMPVRDYTAPSEHQDIVRKLNEILDTLAKQERILVDLEKRAQ